MEKLKALWKKYFSSANAIIRVAIGLFIVTLFILNERADEPVEVLKRLELIAYDMRLKATMPNTIDPRIVIIDLDEKSLQAEGRWPWGRDKVADLVKKTFDDYGVKVLGFDVFFAEPDRSSGLPVLEQLAKTSLKENAGFLTSLQGLKSELDYDARFAEEIKKHIVVLSFAPSNNADRLSALTIGDLPAPVFKAETFKQPIYSIAIDGYSANLKMFQDAADSTGHIIPDIDLDGVLRRVPMMVSFKDGYYEAFSISILRAYFDNEPLSTRFVDDPRAKAKQIEQFRVKDSVIPVDLRTTAFVPFRGPTPMFRYISATDILQGKLTKGELQGKIAIVGTSAQGLLDLRNVPVNSIYPGVEVHANMLSGFLDNRIKQRPESESGIRMLTFMVIGIPLAFVFARASSVTSSILTAVVSATLVAFNLYLWNAGYVLQIAMPLLLVFLLYLLNMAYGFFIEARSKKAITGIFGTYVPKELVDEMAKDPDAYSTKGETREMTVLFSDVRNFTSISEGLSATELTALMNAYLTEMTKTIQTERGTIDKYIGDAIMAFWGAPVKDAQHAEHALKSAIAMQQQLEDIAPDFIKRGWPKLEIGIGLNCGPMNVGDMGSAFRRAYTVMGDAVNLASRLESLTKEYGVGILVSENIVAAVPGMVYRELDRVRVKGKLEPITIYEPVGELGKVVETDINTIDRFHRALERYRQQRWDEAEQTIASLSMADPARKVYKMYLDRIAMLRANPPGKSWDGVFTFTTK
jgi:adenylate cyclase